MTEVAPPDEMLAGTLGIVGGVGWLGSAIARAGLRAGVIAPGRLWLSGRRPRREGIAGWPEVTVTDDNTALATACETVVLSVRPQDFSALDLDLRDRLVVSVMAGVTAATIGRETGAKRIVRSLPNAAAEDALSFTPWHASPSVTEADRATIRAIFGACGEEAQIDAEDQLDLFTALTGSGPAFPALLADALIEAAVERGLAADLAEAAVRQVLRGAGQAIADAKESPAAMVDVFTDYAGTTAAGLIAMQDAGFREAVKRGIDAATSKARALSESEG